MKAVKLKKKIWSKVGQQCIVTLFNNTLIDYTCLKLAYSIY